MKVELDTVVLNKHDLNVSDYVTLYNSYFSIKKGTTLPHVDLPESLLKLTEKGLLSKETGSYRIVKKGADIIEGETDYDFEEFFMSYPAKTPSSRVLRTAKRIHNGKESIDYKARKNAYAKIISTEEEHKEAIRGLKNMVKNHELRGSLNYLPELSVVVNQRKWEQYIEEDIKPKGSIGTKIREAL